MQFNTSSSKYLPAPLPDICASRHELLRDIENATHRGMVYLVAPAGAGKTVAASLWLQTSARKAVWLGLDSYDNSLPLFYRMFCIGLLSQQPSNQRIIDILQNPAFDSLPVEYTIRLIQEFLLEDCKYALVLDDFQTITNQEILKSLFYIIRRLPDSFATIILSRTEMHGEFLRHARLGLATIIDADSLAFSESEIALYLRAMGRKNATKDAKAVLDYTGGWAIAVNVVAQGSQVSFARDASKFLSDYIDEVLWEEWDQEIREFMLASAVLDIMPIDLVEQITGHDNASELLQQLLNRNVFVTQIETNIYRYHHLFLDYLRGKPEFAANYKLNQEHCLTAANYYVQQNNEITARRYALRSGNMQAALAIWSRFFNNNGYSFNDYLEYMQEFLQVRGLNEYCKAYPVLYISRAWAAYLQGDAGAFEALEDELLRNHQNIVTNFPSFAEPNATLLSLDYRVPFSVMMEQASFMKPVRLDSQSVRASSISIHMPYMHRSCRDYWELADPRLFPILEHSIGRLLKDQYPLVVQGISSGLSLEQNKVTKALEHARQGMGMISGETLKELRFCTYMHLATVYYVLGWQTELDLLLETVEREISSQAPFLLPNFLAFTARRKILEGSKDAAAAWLNNYFVAAGLDAAAGLQTNVPTVTKIPFYRIFQFFTTARAHILLGHNLLAESTILGLLELSTNFVRPLDIAEAKTLLAVLYWQTGRKEEALNQLEATLLAMQPHDFIRTIASEGKAIAPALKRILAKVEQPNYSGELDQNYVKSVYLCAYTVAKQRQGIASGTLPKALRLSRQQKLVLSLLAAGYRREDIVEKTGLSLNTVKSHLRLLYQKLEAGNAAEAVTRARELNLI